MIWNKKFIYPTSTRALINGKRHYDNGTNEKLPSVTTILQATQSEEKKKALVVRLSAAEVELKTVQLESEAVKYKGQEAEKRHQRRLADMKAQQEFEAGDRAALVKKLLSATEMNQKLQKDIHHQFK